jgi:hypothetical protein
LRLISFESEIGVSSLYIFLVKQIGFIQFWITVYLYWEQWESGTAKEQLFHKNRRVYLRVFFVIILKWKLLIDFI